VNIFSLFLQKKKSSLITFTVILVTSLLIGSRGLELGNYVGLGSATDLPTAIYQVT